jgi:hypothetical protein
MTLRLPFPKWPCIHMTYCQYATCLITLLSYVGVNTWSCITVVALSESSKCFGMQVFYTDTIISLCSISTLSLSVGIYLQYPHAQKGAFNCSTSSLFDTGHVVAAPCTNWKPSFATLTMISLYPTINYLLSNKETTNS